MICLQGIKNGRNSKEVKWGIWLGQKLKKRGKLPRFRLFSFLSCFDNGCCFHCYMSIFFSGCYCWRTSFDYSCRGETTTTARGTPMGVRKSNGCWVHLTILPNDQTTPLSSSRPKITIELSFTLAAKFGSVWQFAVPNNYLGVTYYVYTLSAYIM